MPFQQVIDAFRADAKLQKMNRLGHGTPNLSILFDVRAIAKPTDQHLGLTEATAHPMLLARALLLPTFLRFDRPQKALS